MPGVDFYALDELLSEEELLARDTVRTWVTDNAAPIIARCYEEGRFPTELIPGLAGLGLLGSTLPEEHGCAGTTKMVYGLTQRELDRCDSGIRSFVSVQSSLCMWPIYTFGTDDHRRRYLPGMARGELIGCFGLTEADAGSDPGAMRTRATPCAGGYRISGSKMWITNGSIADVALIWARVHDGERDTIGGFLVERGTPGLTTIEIKNKLSMRASVTSELVLDEVLVPEQNRLPGARGLKAALACLTQARYGIAWGTVGIAEACYEEALGFVRERRSFGAPLAAKQLVQQKLARMLAEITKCQLLCWRLGRLSNEQRTPARVSLAKRECVATALEIARCARDMLGASGITGEYQAMRHMCNLETVYTYEGAHDIQSLILGEAITGIRAF